MTLLASNSAQKYPHTLNAMCMCVIYTTQSYLRFDMPGKQGGGEVFV